MARHSLPRGRHVHLALPQPATRHAAGEVHGMAGSAPLRRGIAVVAVVGGALSAAGVAAAPGPRLPDPVPTGPLALDSAALGLSARSTPLPRADDPAVPAEGRVDNSAGGDGNRDDASERTTASRDAASRADDLVLDPAAVASTVRKAGEEGKRLAEKDKAEKERAEKERIEKERAEQERAEQQRAEQQRAEQQRAEQQRAEKGRAESDRSEEAGSERAEEGRSEGDDSATASASAATPGSTAAAPPPAGRSGGTASEFPGELIDTNEWYLTLPTGEEGKPDTVDGAQLARYHSKFFQLNESRDGIVFTANAGGATTSGSKYPRSELREMNGDAKASWDGRKGTHTMELDQAITATPGDKPDVIAGQIHATSDDLMQIHLSGTQLTVKYADGKKKVMLDEDYRLGQRFNVKIESSEGNVKVWYDGQQKADLPINSPTSYFKAGAYVNSNTSNGESASAVGQVVVYRADVTHS